MQDQQHLKSSLQGHNPLPEIPDKIYFTIGEASKLCLLEPYVLRYWEQEFPQLSPTKRCGNRRYYKRDEIILIRRIKDLLYSQGFTIDGARLKLGSDRNVSDSVDAKSTVLMKNIVTQLEAVLVDLERDY